MKTYSNPSVSPITRLICILAVLALPFALHAAEAESTDRPPRLFESEDILQVTITAPWQDLTRDKKFQGTYPATMAYQDHAGNPVTHELTVERRGIKRQELCRFPPIRLRFEKPEVRDSLFHGQDSLKMVTHCQVSERYDQYYVLEMMAYRIYNLVTDYSFRVRPLSVAYKDSETGKVEEDRFGFLIEDDSDVAKRNDLRKLVVPYTLPSRMDLATSSDFALFQLLIANLDWSALRGPDPEECCHNVKLIAPRPMEEGDKIWPVPYDFDASGFVNPPYAVPPDGLGINSVTQRFYRGYCAHNSTMEASRQKYISLEADIMGVLDSDPRLTERTKKKANRFLEKYFDLIKDDRDFDRSIIRKCRK